MPDGRAAPEPHSLQGRSHWPWGVGGGYLIQGSQGGGDTNGPSSQWGSSGSALGGTGLAPREAPRPWPRGNCWCRPLSAPWRCCGYSYRGQDFPASPQGSPRPWVLLETAAKAGAGQAGPVPQAAGPALAAPQPCTPRLLAACSRRRQGAAQAQAAGAAGSPAHCCTGALKI